MSHMSSASLRVLLLENRDALTGICERALANDEVSSEVRGLMTSPHLLNEFQSIVETDRELAATVLQAAIGALAHAQIGLFVDAELLRRSIQGDIQKPPGTLRDEA